MITILRICLILIFGFSASLAMEGKEERAPAPPAVRYPFEFYRFKSRESDQISYIFALYHHMAWKNVDPEIQVYLKTAKSVTVEGKWQPWTREYLTQLKAFRSPESPSKKISEVVCPGYLEILNKRLQTILRKLELPEIFIDDFEIGAIGFLILMNSYDGDEDEKNEVNEATSSVEFYLYGKIVQEKGEIFELETLEDQIPSFQTIIQAGAADSEKQLRTWSEAFSKTGQDPVTREFEERRKLEDNISDEEDKGSPPVTDVPGRNLKWVPKIMGIHSGKSGGQAPHLFLFGESHIWGSGGVTNLLLKEGCEVQKYNTSTRQFEALIALD